MTLHPHHGQHPPSPTPLLTPSCLLCYTNMTRGCQQLQITHTTTDVQTITANHFGLIREREKKHRSKVKSCFSPPHTVSLLHTFKDFQWINESSETVDGRLLIPVVTAGATVWGQHPDKSPPVTVNTTKHQTDLHQGRRTTSSPVCFLMKFWSLKYRRKLTEETNSQKSFPESSVENKSMLKAIKK